MEENTLYRLCEKVEKYLNDNRIYSDVTPYGNGLPVINVSISWGDWKHDHGRAKWLMHELGATYVGSEETEENGSDCYSAVHTFIVREDLFSNN